MTFFEKYLLSKWVTSDNTSLSTNTVPSSNTHTQSPNAVQVVRSAKKRCITDDAAWGTVAESTPGLPPGSRGKGLTARVVGDSSSHDMRSSGQGSVLKRAGPAGYSP
ncbi:hypothetical protein BDD12DRAFT_874870 [Trichophaea hybrida]|nr:hypothetical protein BDD12DRAFT_874870 [Trichophaea hybrida]